MQSETGNRAAKGDPTMGHRRAISCGRRVRAIIAAAIAVAGLAATGSAQDTVAERARQSGEPAWRDAYLTVDGEDPQLVAVDDVGGKAVLEGDMVLGAIGDADTVCPPSSYCTDSLVNIPSFKGGTGSWPGGTIPFVCTGSAPCDFVLAAIAHWQSHTGYRFKARTSEAAYVSFSDDDPQHGCWSNVGRTGAKQTIQVSRGCGVGGVIHEIGHSIGLWHEQSRPDRDTYIQVLLGNVIPERQPNFFIVKPPAAVPFGPYDYGSIMHYGARDFGIVDPGQTQPRITIVAPPTVMIGQRDGLSAGDVAGAQGLLGLPPPPVKACFNLSGYAAVGVARSPLVQGAWLAAANGGVFSAGDAHFYGSAGGIRLTKPVVGIAATPTGKGYWLVASDGGIFNYGDARFYGSTGGKTLNKPVVGMAATPTGKGYWLVASDGGIFTFGDAHFYGSTGSLTLNKPVVGMAATSTGKGYWLVASDGGIFNFGDAKFAGSLAGAGAGTIVGIAPEGVAGYWLASKAGCVYRKPQ
jgi:hypothetical protein